MADIVLATLNAKYIHPAFGLRYLLANLGPLRPRAEMIEFDIKKNPAEVVRSVLSENPRIVGLGVHIWNVALCREIVATLKRERPDITIVLGGPEVSFEADQPDVCGLADYVMAGEGELAFAALCRQLLDGARPEQKLIRAGRADVERLVLPYDLYDLSDLSHRLIYAESSRGCPFECEYCVSAHDAPVRCFPLPRLFDAWQRLLDRGARQIKFVDRTFNVHIERAVSILRFFHERLRPGLFVHFEMMPDRFPPELREVVRPFPEGSLQFEIGIQSMNEDVLARIRRKQDLAKAEESFRFLREETGVQIHADLIAGLPGESLESFAAGFDRLVSWRPRQIQVGILKRLRGAAIARHDGEWGMVYSKEPPYEVLENRLLGRATLDRIKHFARYWELIANRGNFVESLPMLLGGSASPFQSFMRLSDWLFARIGRDHSIALVELVRSLQEYLTVVLKIEPVRAAEVLSRDYSQHGRRRDFVMPA